MKKLSFILLKLFFSVATIAGVIVMPSFSSNQPSASAYFSAGIFYAPIAIGFFLLLKNARHNQFNDLFLLSWALGGFYAALLLIGKTVSIQSGLTYTWSAFFSGLIKILCVTPIFQAAIIWFIQSIEKAQRTKTNGMGFFDRLSAKKTLAFLWLFAFLAWIPVFLAYYPAIWAYDVEYQAAEIAAGQFSTHHPLPHTLMIKCCLELGESVFGDYSAGAAIYSLLQMLLLSFSFAYAQTFIIKQLRIPNWLQWIIVIGMNLFPCNSILSVSVTKDVIFGAFFLLFFTDLTRLSLFELSKKRLFFSILTLCLTLLYRNNALFITIAAFFPILCLLSGRRRHIVAIFVSGVALFFGLSAILNARFKPEKPDLREYLHVPIVQLANTVKNRSSQFTESEKADTERWFWSGFEKNYIPYLSDSVKYWLRTDAIIREGRESETAFFRYWLHLGRKYPTDYLDAWLRISLGDWYPDEIIHSRIYSTDPDKRNGYLLTDHKQTDIPIEKKSLFPIAEFLYEKIATFNVHQKIPIVSIFFAPAVYFWFLLFAACYFLGKRKYRLLAPLFPPVFLWLTIILGPCVLIRYHFPIMLVCPILLATMVSVANAENGSMLQFRTES